jgi:uncharacterized protein (DUF1778 family)
MKESALSDTDQKPKAYPKQRVIGFREDQNALLEQAKMVSGRQITDIVRDGAITLARRIISDAKRAKKDL